MTQDAVNPSVVECCIIRKFKLLKTEREVNCTTTYTVNTVRVTPLSLTKKFRDHGREKNKSFARVSLTTPFVKPRQVLSVKVAAILC